MNSRTRSRSSATRSDGVKSTSGRLPATRPPRRQDGRALVLGGRAGRDVATNNGPGDRGDRRPGDGQRRRGRHDPPRRAVLVARGLSTFDEYVIQTRQPPPEEPLPKLIYEKDDRIARLTLNRPEAKNAIDPELHGLLCEAWADFRDDDSLDVAILTGSGDAFCAGADLKTYIPPIIKGERPIREIVDVGFGGLTRGLHRITKPIIGAVNGWALAGGLETALACDVRVASDRAMFGSFEARRGYHHGDGGIARLVNPRGGGGAPPLPPPAGAPGG